MRSSGFSFGDLCSSQIRARSSTELRSFSWFWIFAPVRRRGPLRGYTRLVGAPNYAPSLCSVAGLLLALVLKSRYEDPSDSPSVYRSSAGTCATTLGPGVKTPRTSCSTKRATAAAFSRNLRTHRDAAATGSLLGGRCGCPRRRRSASDQETRDRAERGSAVRGSARASVVAEEDTLADRPRENLKPRVRDPREAQGCAQTDGAHVCSESFHARLRYTRRSSITRVPS
jgi:hypothetical protein